MSNLSSADIYVDILKHNGTSSAIPMDYTEERNQPLLENPREWKMSLIRMDFPSYAIPKRLYAKPPLSNPPDYFNPIPAFNSTDIYDTDNSRWSITLAYQNPAGVEPIISRVFIQPFAAAPDPPFVWTQEIQPPVLSFQETTGAINAALETAYDNIVTQYNIENPLGLPGAPGSNPWLNDADAALRAQNPPFISYNNITEYFGIYNPVENRDGLPTTDIPNNGIYTSINPHRTELWMNYSLYKLFTSFDVHKVEKDSNITGRVFRIKSFQLPLYTAATSNIYADDYIAGYDLLRQEFQTTNLWYDIYKILLLSKTMENRKEYIASQIVRESGSSGIGSTRHLNILADFDYEFSTAGATRIKYIPFAEFRWIDLLTNTPLRKIDIQIAIINKEEPDKIIPLYLRPGDNFNCKLVFRKKGCGYNRELDEKEEKNNQNNHYTEYSNGGNWRNVNIKK